MKINVCLYKNYLKFCRTIIRIRHGWLIKNHYNVLQLSVVREVLADEERESCVASQYLFLHVSHIVVQISTVVNISSDVLISKN